MVICLERGADLHIIIIIIIIREYYYGGAVALLLQDQLTMSVSHRESIYRETLPKQHSFQFLTEGDQSRRIPDMSRQRVPGSCCSRRESAVAQC